MKIALLHYTYVPSIAGVELIMEQHAKIFADLGHDVTVLTGSGVSDDPRIQVRILPPLQKEHPLRIEADVEISAGNPGKAFAALVAECTEILVDALKQHGRIFVHNVFTMPFHLACTVALWNAAQHLPTGRIVNWIHDLAASTPDYTLPAAWPWDLLRRRCPGVKTVTISDWRAEQYKSLTGTEVDEIIPNGIDPLAMLNLTPRVAQFAKDHSLLEADLLLFQPARILRRKNIQLGLRLVEELKSNGLRVKLLVSGAPDEHNPASLDYHRELRDLRAQLALEEDIFFIHEFFPVTKADLLALYALTDVVWFPSQREGFGVPLLEGALHRMPVFSADTPPMNTFALPNIHLFPPAAPIREIASQLLQIISQSRPFMCARKEVVRRFGWAALQFQLEALLTPLTR